MASELLCPRQGKRAKMTQRFYAILPVLGLLAAPMAGADGLPPQAGPEVRAAAPSGGDSLGLAMVYGQSAALWSTYQGVSNAHGSVPIINSLLTRNYGTYQEGFSRVSAELEVPGAGDAGGAGLARKFYVGTAAEADGFGVAENPVVPELHADLLVDQLLTAGALGRIEPWGLSTRIGVVAGMGYEKRIDEYSTDLIDHQPIPGGILSIYGLDQEVSRVSAVGGGGSLEGALLLRETLFVPTLGASSLDPNRGTEFVTFRWKQDTKFWEDVRLPGLQDARVGIESILGPQPLPVDILPRSWDYVHRLQSFPELGAMAGGGAVLKGGWSPRGSFESMAGFYGGYWGGALSGRLGDCIVSLGSWGIESSSAYQGLGQRIWTAAMGYSL